MIVLTPPEEFRIALRAAPATNQLQVAVSYATLIDGSLVYTPTSNDVVTAGVTPVAAVTAPPTNSTTAVTFLSVTNDDTAPVLFLVWVFDGASNRQLLGFNLDVGDTLVYTETRGFTVSGVEGGEKLLPVIPGRLLRAPQILTTASSGVYSPPAGCSGILVEIWGAGGGGGGCSNTAANVAVGGGGGGGGYARKFFSSPAKCTYTVGTGGAGGSNAGGVGTDGNNSSFTDGITTLSVFGGKGGAGQVAGTTKVYVAGGAGAPISTGGDVNAAGQPGENAIRHSGTVGRSGAGGGIMSGMPGLMRLSAGAGNAGIRYVVGGGGAMTSGAGAQTGGSGSAAVITVSEYT